MILCNLFTFFNTDDFTPKLHGGKAKFTKKVDLLFFSK